MRNISERAFVTVFNLTQKLFRKRNNDSIQFYDKADIDFINIRVKNKIDRFNTKDDYDYDRLCV